MLRGLLSDSNHELIKGNACEALSRLGASADAVKVIAAQLGSLKLAHRCATALAALGSAEAYKALFDSTRAKLERGPISPQQVRALASFKGKGEELKGLLKEVSEAEVLTAETRAMARRELARLR